MECGQFGNIRACGLVGWEWVSTRLKGGSGLGGKLRTNPLKTSKVTKKKGGGKGKGEKFSKLNYILLSCDPAGVTRERERER